MLRGLHRPHARSGLMLGGLLGVAVAIGACARSQQPAPAVAPLAAPAVAIPAEPVRRETIQRSLAYSGEIRAREQVTVLPKGTGRVERLLVDVGSQVNAGDVLANLDADAARVQVLQARAGLAAAQAKLSSLEAGGRAEDVSAAEAALRQAQIKLADLQGGGRAEDVLHAQAALDAQQAKLDLLVRGGRPEAVAQAEAGLAAAQAKLNALEKGATNDLRQAAQSAVDADRDALASAEAAYFALGASNAADLQAAQSQVETLSAQVEAARAGVASADATLAALDGTLQADVQQAQSAVDQAVAEVRAAQAAFDQARNPTQAAINEATAALEAARAERQQSEAQQSALEQNAAGVCLDLPGQPRNSTACGTAKSAADVSVRAGNAAIEAAQARFDLLKRGGSPADKARLQSNLDAAQAQVKAAAQNLDALRNGGIQAQRAQAQAQKEQASSQLVAGQQSLKLAQARLSAAENGSLDAQVKAGQAQVTAARERLKSDQARLDQLVDGATEEDLAQAQAGVDAAVQMVLLAQQPASDQDIRAQRAAVEQARLELAKARDPHTRFERDAQEQAVGQAQAQLDARRTPYTEHDLAGARAAVDLAQAQLELAELNLQDTRVLAPVDGVVAERPAAPGALVSPQTPLVVLVPPSLELVVNVEERQLGQIAEGQRVQLEVAAFAGQPFEGKVKTIAPVLDSKSRSAAVRIEPTDEDRKLRAGMFARLSIVTADRENALVVPREALLGDQAVLLIDADNTAHRRPVSLGLQNDRFVEVLSGLREGDLVATSHISDVAEGEAVNPQVQTVVALAR